MDLKSTKNTEQSICDYFDQILNLRNALEADLVASDLKWSIFVAAANSYRYDSMLKPYPIEYQINGKFDIEQLLRVIAQVPSLPMILKNIKSHTLAGLTKQVVSLLHWVIIVQNDPHLKSIPKNQFKTILNNVGSIVPSPCPTHIFEIVYSPMSVGEIKFENYAKESGTQFAFHGSKLDSFHSILNYGLQQHLCKTSLFGEGVYLSSEMHVSMTFSPFGAGWGSSQCGGLLSCVAMCEFVNHPDYLKRHVQERQTNRSQQYYTVPDKYFVITNNEIVRLRYLIVFGQHVYPKNPKDSNGILNWIITHKALLAILFYAAILLFVGLSKSQ